MAVVMSQDEVQWFIGSHVSYQFDNDLLIHTPSEKVLIDNIRNLLAINTDWSASFCLILINACVISVTGRLEKTSEGIVIYGLISVK